MLFFILCLLIVYVLFWIVISFLLGTWVDIWNVIGSISGVSNLNIRFKMFNIKILLTIITGMNIDQ